MKDYAIENQLRGDDRDYQNLKRLARILRFRMVRTSHLSGVPHLASCLSCVDILVFLYWRILNIDPNKPRDVNRDRFFLSKGHAAPALFQVLAEKGFYPVLDLEKFGENNTFFGEHPPTPDHLPGIEAATGSLGHGLPMALGVAIAGKIRGDQYQVYALLGDGECNEGSIWEAALLAASKRVNNLTVLIDYNKWQATGRSDEIMSISPLVEKWHAFGWSATEVDGHNFEALSVALRGSKHDPRPKAIICHTVKGGGVKFMEDDNNWHYRIPTAEEVLRCAQLLQIPSQQIALSGRTPLIHD